MHNIISRISRNLYVIIILLVQASARESERSIVNGRSGGRVHNIIYLLYTYRTGPAPTVRMDTLYDACYDNGRTT